MSDKKWLPPATSEWGEPDADAADDDSLQKYQFGQAHAEISAVIDERLGRLANNPWEYGETIHVNLPTMDKGKLRMPTGDEYSAWQLEVLGSHDVVADDHLLEKLAKVGPIAEALLAQVVKDAGMQELVDSAAKNAAVLGQLSTETSGYNITQLLGTLQLREGTAIHAEIAAETVTATGGEITRINDCDVRPLTDELRDDGLYWIDVPRWTHIQDAVLLRLDNTVAEVADGVLSLYGRNGTVKYRLVTRDETNFSWLCERISVAGDIVVSD